MASPFGVRFFTRGYEKTSREMSSIEHKAKGISTGFVRMGQMGAKAGPMAAQGINILRIGMVRAIGIMKSFLAITLQVSTAIGVLTTVVGLAGINLATKFAKGLMTTRENFYLIETAMTGIVKNAGQVRKISEWAMKYAAEYPAMYGDVMEAMKGMAMMPSLKPIFTAASVKDMEKIMNIVQSLGAIDPAQGVKGALFAMREALSGQWRSMQMRFEIRPQDIAAAAGLTLEELKTMPEKAIDALDAFTKLNVGADTLRESALSLGVQFGNLKDRYEIWLNTVAQYGAYQKLVSFLKNMNDLWDSLLKSGAAKRLGQDISRVFEAAIEGIESTITGVDWEGKGIFGGLLEAAKGIIKKIGNIFTDAKEFLAASLEVAIIYMKQALLFSIKNIFWPVGVEIAKTIGDAFMEAIQKHPIQAWLGAMVAGGVTAGIPGALVAGGTAAVGIAGMEVAERMPSRRQIVERRIITLEAGGLEEAKGKIKELKEELVELKKIAEGKVKIETPFGEKFVTESEAALEKMAVKYKEFQGLIVEKVGPRKEIPEITSVEEQMKNIIKARIDLRSKELTATKQQVEVSRNNLAHLERMLEYHKKTAAWKADPKRGGMQERLKVEIKETEDFMTQFLKGRTKEEIASGKIMLTIEPVIKGLAEKRKELEQLTKQFEIDVGAVPARHTGAELEAKALETLEKQKELKAAILETEQKIAILKIKGGENVNQLIALEVQLFNLTSQKLAAEQQIDEISKKQQENAKKIAKVKETGATDLGALVDLEKESVGLSEAKLKAEQQIAGAAESQKNVKDQILQLETQIVEKKKESVEAEKEVAKEAEKKEKTTAHGVALYSKLGQLMAKAAQAVKLRGEFLGTYGKKQVAESAKVALGESEHQRRMAHFQYFSPKEMSKSEADAYLRTSESRLQGELAGAKTLEAQRSILERLYNLNKEQYQRAGTPVVRETEYRDATNIMERLLSVETEQYEENRRIAEIQSANIANIYTEATKANGLLKLILGKTDFDISTMTAKDVERLRGANPQTTPEFAF